MLLIALGPACGGLVPVASDRAARLRLQFQPGQVFRFRTELRGVQVFGTGPTPPGLSMQSVTDVTHRVVSVDRDEGATLEVDADPVSATTNGQEVQLRTNPEPWQIVVAAEGAILDSTRPIAFDTGDQPGEGPDVQTNPTGAINPFPHLATGPRR